MPNRFHDSFGVFDRAPVCAVGHQCDSLEDGFCKSCEEHFCGLHIRRCECGARACLACAEKQGWKENLCPDCDALPVCPNCGKRAGFVEKSGDFVETHGLDCGPYETWHEEWLECRECGAETDWDEVARANNREAA